jgi:hypothetical protein
MGGTVNINTLQLVDNIKIIEEQTFEDWILLRKKSSL